MFGFLVMKFWKDACNDPLPTKLMSSVKFNDNSFFITDVINEIIWWVSYKEIMVRFFYHNKEILTINVIYNFNDVIYLFCIV